MAYRIIIDSSFVSLDAPTVVAKAKENLSSLTKAMAGQGTTAPTNQPVNTYNLPETPSSTQCVLDGAIVQTVTASCATGTVNGARGRVCA